MTKRGLLAVFALVAMVACASGPPNTASNPQKDQKSEPNETPCANSNPCAAGCKSVGGACKRDLGVVVGEDGKPLKPLNTNGVRGEDDARLGQGILACLHPTGNFVYASFRDPVLRSDGIAEAEGSIKWKGGFTNADYRTDVSVQFRKVSGQAEVRVRVLGENSVVPYNQNCRLLSWTPIDLKIGFIGQGA